MTIHWFHLFTAVLMLWLPRQVLRMGGQYLRRRHRSHRTRDTNPAKARQPGDMTVGFSVEFGKFRNYIDLLRGGLGAVALLGGLPGIEAALQVAHDAPTATVRFAWVVSLVILLVGVLIQSLRFEGKLSLFAPIFYFAGMSLALCGPTVAIFAFALVWAINMALPNPTGFLMVYALLLAGFSGLFVRLDEVWTYVMAGFTFLPAFIGLLSRRAVVVFTKKAKIVSAGAT